MAYPLVRVTPQPGLVGRGTQGGVPPIRVPPGQVRQDGGYPRWHTPLVRVTPQPSPTPPPRTGPGRGTPHLDLAGVPRPPPPGVDRQNHRRTDKCQNITFPRTTYAVGNNLELQITLILKSILSGSKSLGEMLYSFKLDPRILIGLDKVKMYLYTLGHAYNEYKDAKETARCRWVLVEPNFLTLLSMSFEQRNLLVIAGSSL